MTKRNVALAVLVPLGVFLLAASQVWVSGRTTDAVLGSATLGVTGTQATPAAVALGLVVGAALLALLTGGRAIRRIAGIVQALAAAGAVALVVPVLGDPSAVIGRRAAEVAGRTGSLGASGNLSVWAWTALAALMVLLGSSLAGAWSARRWDGLSARFDRSQPDQPDSRGARRSAWDELSEGHDPTHDASPRTPGSST
ncbi:MAG: Trp biosynthesis-associated membrane protein [Dermatophilaceae bacterium]|nr:Trp biosynthesis-associated membrane protein [Dermatophilaceae bacterium]